MNSSDDNARDSDAARRFAQLCGESSASGGPSTDRIVVDLLSRLDPQSRRHVLRAMTETLTTVDAAARTPKAAADTSLRSHQPGDIGWVTHRHGMIYAAEYGWDGTFEAMVARVAAEFIERFNPATDRCFIAEQAGAIVGSAFVVHKAHQIAKLRLVYVEPSMRGTGLGRRLVEASMHFAREAGYTRMTLWTNDVLVPARRLYETLGFVMTASEAYRGFGQDLVGETWERDL